MKLPLLLCLAALCVALPVRAATWSYEWPASTEAAPKVEIAPLQWGKTWAYSVEIDDGPASTLSVAAPLLARFNFSDAPPGVAGGRLRPFVGGAAIFLSRFDVDNETLLDAKALENLRAAGWELLNHSYWHSGNSWEATGALSDADIRRELFWSQSLMAALSPDGRAPTHFVYPNGYTKYSQQLAQFGFRSASRVGATSKRTIDEAVWLDLDRNNLDEGAWNDARQGLPTEPKIGDWTIDFTHGINGDASSTNFGRWQSRLQFIDENWGARGDDSVWCAPTNVVAAYVQAAQAAKLSVENGQLSLEIPDDLPGTALTLHFSGLSLSTKLEVPTSATLYRRGDEAWLTTPVLGKAGTAPPARLERIYAGEPKNVTFDKPRHIAGVRLRQNGSAATFALSIDLIGVDDAVSPLVAPEKAALGSNWGFWHLFPTVPDGEAPLCREVRLTSDASLKQMEVWALVD